MSKTDNYDETEIEKSPSPSDIDASDIDDSGSGSGTDSESVSPDDSDAGSVVETDIDAELGEDEDTPKVKPKQQLVASNEVLDKFINTDEQIDDNESIDSDFSEEEYVKFDDDIRKDQILNYHNDLIQSNFDEISALTKVVRNKDGIIVDPLHKTIPILTKYERTRILGLRAKQLNNGDEPLIKIPDNIIQGYVIAEMELEQKVLPFIVSRPLPNGKKEYWKLNDLEQIDY